MQIIYFDGSYESVGEIYNLFVDKYQAKEENWFVYTLGKVNSLYIVFDAVWDSNRTDTLPNEVASRTLTANEDAILFVDGKISIKPYFTFHNNLTDVLKIVETVEKLGYKSLLDRKGSDYMLTLERDSDKIVIEVDSKFIIDGNDIIGV